MNNNSHNTPTNSSSSVNAVNTALALQTQDTPLIRQSPDEFIEFCFTDPSGRGLRQAPVHRDLQDFLSRHRRALVELPRDHGKSVQICLRLLWELGRDPSLRVRIVCASDAMAAERCRFLRDAITHNERLRIAPINFQPLEHHGSVIV